MRMLKAILILLLLSFCATSLAADNQQITLSDSKVIKIKTVDHVYDFPYGKIKVLHAVHNSKPTYMFNYCSIMIIDGIEYFISKRPNDINIRNFAGKQFDLPKDTDGLSDETRIYRLIKTIGYEKLPEGAIWITFPTCNDCWTDNYCSKHCAYEHVCSWHKGCLHKKHVKKAKK